MTSHSPRQPTREPSTARVSRSDRPANTSTDNLRERIRTPPSRAQLGAYGEQLAELHLHGCGYRIVARNARAGRREIDRIALDGRTLCFIEVRLRSSHSRGSAEDSIDARKQRQVVRAARTWLSENRPPKHDDVRFDVVAIDARWDPPKVSLYRAAFEASGR